MPFKKIHFETYDLPVTVCVYYGLMSPFEDYQAVYALIGHEDVEIGSSKNVCRRIYSRPRNFWPTHLAWIALKDVPSITLEDVRFIEATCIFAASNSKFMGRHLRNKQFAKSLGRFADRKDSLQTVAYEFLAAIEEGYQSCPKYR